MHDVRFLRRLAAAAVASLLLSAAVAVPAFTLTDHSARPITETDFRGGYLLVYFGYTFCPDAGPTDLQRMATVLDAFGPDGPRGLFVSIDPGRDSPVVLKEYVAAFHPRLTGATAAPEQLTAVAEQFGARFHLTPPDASGGYLVSHSTAIFLVGPDGALIGRFVDAAPETIVGAIHQDMAAQCKGSLR